MVDSKSFQFLEIAFKKEKKTLPFRKRKKHTLKPPYHKRHSKISQIFEMHFCLYWYWLHSQGRSNKNGIFDVVTPCSIFYIKKKKKSKNTV